MKKATGAAAKSTGRQRWFCSSQSPNPCACRSIGKRRVAPPGDRLAARPIGSSGIKSSARIRARTSAQRRGFHTKR